VLSWARHAAELANGAIATSCTSIAVIASTSRTGVPIYLRWRAGDAFEAGAWSSGSTKVDHAIAVLWIVFIVILFLLPTVPRHPVAQRLQLNVVNYAQSPWAVYCSSSAVVAGVGAQMVPRARSRRRAGGARAHRGDMEARQAAHHARGSLGRM